jgi:hypothetical protein
LNFLFTVVFTVELSINGLAHWFWPFLTDAWSQVDVFVVAMSIVPLLVPEQNTGIVRILRAFRILRLFRRVPSLRKIITALTMALLPVLNVFCILFLLIGICKRWICFGKYLPLVCLTTCVIFRGGCSSVRVQRLRP